MAEVQKQNQQNKSEVYKQALSPEQEVRLQKEKEQVLLLSKMQRNDLSNDIIADFLQTNYNLDFSKYPHQVKQKCIEEVQVIFTEFKDFDESTVTKLREIRENMSMGMESWKSNEYYRNMIFWSKIDARVKILKAAIETQYGETTQIKWKLVNKADYEEMKSNIQTIDSNNGLKVFDKIMSSLRPWITMWLHFNGINIEQIYKDECKNNHIPYDETLLKQYQKKYSEFVNKYLVYASKDGNWVIKYNGKWFWFQNGGVTGMNYKTLEKTYQETSIDIEKMWVADLIIMMRVLFWVLPIAGDIVWWYDDLKQANAKINFDGSMQWFWENMLWYLTWVLGITVVWGTFWKIAKWPKMAKIMMTIGKVIEKLSKSWELRLLAKNEKIMALLESMKWVVPKIEELLAKMNKTKFWAENVNTNIISEKDKSIGKMSRLIKNNSNVTEKIKNTPEKVQKNIAVLTHSTWLERWEMDLPNRVLQSHGLTTLTPKQFQEVKRIHSEVSKWVYKNDTETLRVMTQDLKKVWLNKQQIRVLMEEWITGEFKFDESFFQSVGKLSNDINRNGLDWFLESLSTKQLSLEQVTVILQENSQKFHNITDLNEHLALYDIKAVSPEIFFLAKKWFDTLRKKELLSNPRLITKDDLEKLYLSWNLEDFNELFAVFVQKGDKIQLNQFFEKIVNGNLPLDYSKISLSSLKELLASAQIDKKHIWKIVWDIVAFPNLTWDYISLLQSFLSKHGTEFFTQERLWNLGVILETKLNPAKSENIIKGFLKWENYDFNLAELSKQWSLARNLWNDTFYSFYDTRYELILKWKSEFFFDVHIDNFFNGMFFSLNQAQQAWLYNLIKEGGEYHKKIQWFRRYEEILQTAKTAYNKINK